jgi:hypothetical protein
MNILSKICQRANELNRSLHNKSESFKRAWTWYYNLVKAKVIDVAGRTVTVACKAKRNGKVRLFALYLDMAKLIWADGTFLVSQDVLNSYAKKMYFDWILAL